MKSPARNVVFLCCLFSIQLLHAQVRYGVEVGLNVANQTNAYYNGSKYVTGKAFIGLQEGAFAEIPVSKDFIFKPELLGDMGGTKIPALPDAKAKTVKLVYVKLPLNALYVSHFSFGNIVAGGGPYAGILCAARVNGAKAGINQPRRYGYSLLDFGLNVCAQLETKIGLIAGIKYSQGITTVTDNKARNMIGTLYVGYALPFY